MEKKYIITGPVASPGELPADGGYFLGDSTPFGVGDLYQGSSALIDHFGIGADYNQLTPDIDQLLTSVHCSLSSTYKVVSTVQVSESEFISRCIRSIQAAATTVNSNIRLSNSAVLGLFRMELNGQLATLSNMKLTRMLAVPNANGAVKIRNLTMRLANDVYGQKFIYRMLDRFPSTPKIPAYGVYPKYGRIDCIAPADLSEADFVRIECTLRGLFITCRIYDSDPADDLQEMRNSLSTGSLPTNLLNRPYQLDTLMLTEFPSLRPTQKEIARLLAGHGIAGSFIPLGGCSETDENGLSTMQ